MQGGKEVKEMATSSGSDGHETPQGTFEIQNRGEWFYSDKYAEGAKWWVSFRDWGVYLFHSVVMDQNQQIIPTEAAKLGTPASHGCLRLAVADAKWIYDNVPQGTKVVIHA
jgi:lipoprotein-anchoring transpeptidase ErfK/SrfK